MIGLTGGIATGKTTVANIFKRLGSPIIDLDRIAHEVVKPGTKSYQEIVGVFGREVLNPKGDINRNKLAHLIFKDKTLREKLNKITHPVIIKEMKRRAGLLSFPVIVDAPLLFEVDLVSFFDKIIVVTCREEAQIKRLRKRDSLGAEEARQRMASQLPLSAKAKRADFLINNDGSFEEIEEQVEKIWKKLVGSKRDSSSLRR